jgi:lipopolysaccharide export system permease protein
MKALDRYVFGQLMTTTFATALALTVMVWLTQSLRLFDYIVNRGLPAETFLQLAVLLMPSFLTIVLPIAVFVSVLFIYNKLTTESELIVMRACGLGPSQVGRPALMVALVVTLIMYLITLYVLPASFRNFKDLQHDIRNNYSSVLLQEGVFTEIDEHTVIYISGRTPNGQLLDILVHDTREPEQPTTIMAEVAEIVGGANGPVLVLYNGQRQQFDRDNQTLSNLSFERYALELANTAGGDREWREPAERYLHEIFTPAQSELDEKYRGELLANGHQRLVMPLYVPAFVMLAMAPFLLGEFSRRGYWKRVLVVVVVVAVLQVQLLALEDLVSGNLTLVPLMYVGVLLPNLALAWLLFLHQPKRRRRRRPVPQAA